MSRIELIATATFGLEAVVRREIENLGYKILKSEDAKITYLADERGIVRSNLFLRCADPDTRQNGRIRSKNIGRSLSADAGAPLGGMDSA